MSTILRDYFKNAWQNYHSRSEVTVPLDDRAFGAFLRVDIRGECAEVPICMAPYYKDAYTAGCTHLVFNLVNGSDRDGRRTFTQKTASTILGWFETAGGNDMRLAHVVTTKGIDYYGGKGIILDGALNPLMITTAMLKLQPDGRLKAESPACKLSYRVFENSSELVEKTILKQAIPLWGTISVSGSCDDQCFQGRVKISIEDLDPMVVRPSVPNPSVVSNTLFNRIIAQNYDNS